MTYLSRPDRRAETEPAEERVIELIADVDDETGEITVERADFSRLERCPWCQIGVRNHSPEQIALCEAAFQTAMNRRLSGPVRIGDVAGRRP